MPLLFYILVIIPPGVLKYSRSSAG